MIDSNYVTFWKTKLWRWYKDQWLPGLSGERGSGNQNTEGFGGTENNPQATMITKAHSSCASDPAEHITQEKP